MPCLSELSRGTCRWRVRSCILLALRRAGGSQRQGISAGINLTHRGTQHTGGRFRRIRRIRRKKSNVDQSRPTDCCVRCKRERSSATLRGSTSRRRRRSDECPRPGCAWLRNPDAGQARCRTCKKRHSTASWTAKPVLLARGTRGLRHVRKARAARRPARPRETVAGGGQDVQCGVCSDEEKLGSRPTTMRREKLSFSPLQDKRGIVQNDKGSADCEGPWRHRQYGRRGGCTSAVPCGRAS